MSGKLIPIKFFNNKPAAQMQPNVTLPPLKLPENLTQSQIDIFKPFPLVDIKKDINISSIFQEKEPALPDISDKITAPEQKTNITKHAKDLTDEEFKAERKKIRDIFLNETNDSRYATDQMRWLTRETLDAAKAMLNNENFRKPQNIRKIGYILEYINMYDKKNKEYKLSILPKLIEKYGKTENIYSWEFIGDYEKITPKNESQILSSSLENDTKSEKKEAKELTPFEKEKEKIRAIVLEINPSLCSVILFALNKDNIEATKLMLADEKIRAILLEKNPSLCREILFALNKDNIEAAKLMLANENFTLPHNFWQISGILRHINKVNEDDKKNMPYRLSIIPKLIEKYAKFKDIDSLAIMEVYEEITPETEKLYLPDSLENNVEFEKSKERIRTLLLSKTKDSDEINDIINLLDENNFEIAENVCQKGIFTKLFEIKDLITRVNGINKDFVKALCTSDKCKIFRTSKCIDFISRIAKKINPNNIEFANWICFDDEAAAFRSEKDSWGSCYNISRLIEYYQYIPEQINWFCKSEEAKCFRIEGTGEKIADIIEGYQFDPNFVNWICKSEESKSYRTPETVKYIPKILWQYKEKYMPKFVNWLCKSKETQYLRTPENIQYIPKIIDAIGSVSEKIAKSLLTDKEYAEFRTDTNIQYIPDIIGSINDENIDYVKNLLFDKEFAELRTPDNICLFSKMIRDINEGNYEFAKDILSNKEYAELREPHNIKYIGDILRATYIDNIDKAKEFCKDKNFPVKFIADFLIDAVEKDIYYKIKEKIPNIDEFTVRNIIFANNNIEFLGKENYYELSLAAKKEYFNKMLTYEYISDEKLQKYFPIFPTNDTQYIEIMNSIKNIQNISEKPLSKEKINDFNNTLEQLSNYLKDTNLDNLHTISLSLSHQEFIDKFNEITKGLSNEQKSKLQAYFCFQIENGKLYNVPKLINKEIPTYLQNEQELIKLIPQLSNLVKEFSDSNIITIENNPQLEKFLNNIRKDFPEILNSIDGSESFVNNIKAMQKIIQNPEFENLENSDKRILLFAALFRDTNKCLNSTDEIAKDILGFALKLDFSKTELMKLYKLIQNSDAIDKAIDTSHNKKIIYNLHFFDMLTSTQKKNEFDMLAFNLSNGNTFELAKILYSAKYIDGLTRQFNKLLEKKVSEIKSQNFILPQTQKETILKYAEVQELKGKKVKVVPASKIPDFFGYIHTPEVAFASSRAASRARKLSNFNLFRQLGDDKTICQSYIRKGSYSIAGKAMHAILSNVNANNEYVGFNIDMWSCSKTIAQMIMEYYQNQKVQSYNSRGTKDEERKFVSLQIKRNLYENYDNLPDEEKIQKDNDYIQRLDKIIAVTNGGSLDLEAIEKIDSEFGKAYRKFLQLNTDNKTIFNNKHWNEVIVSNPEPIGVVTKDINNLPQEYLDFVEDLGEDGFIIDLTK